MSVREHVVMPAFNGYISALLVASIFGIGLAYGVPQEPFFLGTFVHNVTVEPKSNWSAVYQRSGVPSFLVGQSFVVDMTQAGPQLFRLVETAMPSGLVLQDLYFQLGVENTTSFPDNVKRQYKVTAVGGHALQFVFVEVLTSKMSSSTVEFRLNDYTLTLRVGDTVGLRHYVKKVDKLN